MAPESVEKVGVVIVHGVGEADPGWINDGLIPSLASRSEGRLALEDFSEVHLLDDNRTPRKQKRRKSRATPLPRRKHRQKFQGHMRRGRTPSGVEVAFAELYWADLSRIGDGALSRTWELTRLFFEAPNVLARQFLRESPAGLQWLVHHLIVFSAWLVRFPISGVFLSGFVAAFGVVFWRELMPFIYADRLLPVGLVAILFFQSAAAGTIYYHQSHRNLGLSDLAIGVCISSALMALAIVGLTAGRPSPLLTDTKYYLAGAVTVVMLGWLVWTGTVLVAMVLLLLSAIKRMFWIGKEHSGIVMRSATGLALIILQSIIWKTVVGLFTIPAMELLAPKFTENASVICQFTESVISTQCQVFRAYEVLTYVFTISVLSLAAVALAYLLVILARILVRFIFWRRSVAGEIAPPRILVSVVLILTLFAAFLFNTVVLYGGAEQWQQAREMVEGVPRAPMIVLGEDRKDLLSWLRDLFSLYAASGFAGLLLALHLFNGLQSASAGLLHIGRDIVDHRYRVNTRSKMKLPTASRPKSTYPRRQRIQNRLQQIVERLLLPGDFDRLVFVAHSQGTVIVYDYLKDDHDNKIVNWENNTIERIDVVTVGSPLSHIYQRYFDEYEKGVPTAARLNQRLASWTNLWRIDDPIGQRVDIIGDGFIANVPLGPGGHTTYWTDPMVANRILALIDPDLLVKDGDKKADAPHDRPAEAGSEAKSDA